MSFLKAYKYTAESLGRAKDILALKNSQALKSFYGMAILRCTLIDLQYLTRGRVLPIFG